MSVLNRPDRIAGFPCPVCGVLIPTSINDLLSVSPLTCPACRLQLEVDPNHSSKALEILSKVQEAQENVKSASTFNG